LTALAIAERQDWLVQEMAARQLSFQPGQTFSWQRLADAVDNDAARQKNAGQV
jgi:hypothetical protein